MNEAQVALGGIVDCHHHVWRMADLDWLNGPDEPRIFGRYESIKADYPIEEYIVEARGVGITQSVYVQTNWPRGRDLDEVAWVAGLHEATGWPSAAIGHVDMLAEDAGDRMREQLQACPILRGTRMQLHWHENRQFRFASEPRQMLEKTFNKNIDLLSSLGWVFELQVFASQMRDAAEMVSQHPDVTFVLLHGGMLVDRNDRSELALWRDGLHRLAGYTNVVVKASGLGTFVHRLDKHLIGFIWQVIIDEFGSERVMFGTNFPIERMWTTMQDLVAVCVNAVGGRSENDRRLIFADNARRIYGLDYLPEV